MTKPTDCVIAFALPTSEAGFRWAGEQPYAEYVHRFYGGWDQYGGVCADLRHCIDECSRHGAVIEEELKVEKWSSLFCHGVVILFAHWISEGTSSPRAPSGAAEGFGEHRDFVELWDRRASIGHLVDAIPEEFDGILDLSVCHPAALVDKIKRYRRRCTVKYSPDELLPSIWAEIYVAAFGYLGRFRQGGAQEGPPPDYCDVLEQVTREFRTQSRGGK